FRLDPCLCLGAAAGASVAGIALPGGLRPASRLVSFLAARILRHPRARTLRRGADPRLRARRAGPQNVEIARQRRLAAGGDEAARRRHPAAVGGRLGLFGRPAHWTGDLEAPRRSLSTASQHLALSARQPGGIEGGRKAPARADAGTRALGSASL